MFALRSATPHGKFLKFRVFARDAKAPAMLTANRLAGGIDAVVSIMT
jgi:hypothetical protein